MASITIQNLGDAVKERLRVRAARHGYSMEGEAGVILRNAIGSLTGSQLWKRSRALVSTSQGIELDLLARNSDRPVPRLE